MGCPDRCTGGAAGGHHPNCPSAPDYDAVELEADVTLTIPANVLRYIDLCVSYTDGHMILRNCQEALAFPDHEDDDYLESQAQDIHEWAIRTLKTAIEEASNGSND